MSNENETLSPMLRVQEILDRTTLSRSCFYAQIQQGLAPPLIPLSDRARGQYEVVVDAWIAVRAELRRSMSRLREPVVLPAWRPEMVCEEFPSGMRLLKLREVVAQVGLESSQLYRLIDVGRFPAPVPLTRCARRWLCHEVREWLRGREALSLRISGKRKLRRPPDDDRPSA